MTRPAIILFTRAPVRGMGKTRLSSFLSQDERVLFQRACISDEIASMRAAAENILVFCTPFAEADAIRELGASDLAFFPQEGEDLGEKMLNAFRKAFSLGYGPCLLAGSDIPEISPGHFAHAFSLIRENDVVITPTADGGYCLIGMGRPLEAPFAAIEYGTKSVFESTSEAIAQSGLSLGVTSPIRDIDTPEELIDFASRAPLPQCPLASKLALELVGGKAFPR